LSNASRAPQKIVLDFDPRSCKGFLEKSPLADELAEKWFGKYFENRLELDLVEVAYLLLQGRAHIRYSNSFISDLDNLVSTYPQCFEKFFWPMLTVYKDLRDRGRRVKVIEAMKFLVRDKSGDLRLIQVLEEKTPLQTSRVFDLIDEARRNNLKVTLAIVSLHGELTYYELVQADLRAE